MSGARSDAKVLKAGAVSTAGKRTIGSRGIGSGHRGKMVQRETGQTLTSGSLPGGPITIAKTTVGASSLANQRQFIGLQSAYTYKTSAKTGPESMLEEARTVHQ